MTDDLLDAVRELPKVGEVPARPGAVRLRRRAEADEAELHRELLPRDARPLPREGAGRGGQLGLHRRLLRRDGGELPRRPMDLVREREVQELLHLQVQRAARHEGRRPLPGRRARGGEEAAQQRPARDPEREQPAPTTARRIGEDGRGAGRRPEPPRRASRRARQATHRPQHDRSHRRLRRHRAAHRPDRPRARSTTPARSRSTGKW